MPEEPDTSARQRFSHDLRRIREEREVTIAEVHETTRITTSQIQSFEAGTLYDQPSMNRVYVRAFVREYARAIGVPPDAVAEQLEAALDGTYENQLAVQFLDVPPEVVEPEPSEASAASTDKESTEGEPQAPSDEEHEQETDSSPPPRTEEDKEASVQEEGAEYDWKVLLTGLGVVLLVGLLAGLGISHLTGAGTSEDETTSMESALEAGASSSSPSSDSSTSPSSPPPASLTLGDTLHLTVLATSRVQELRVQQDEDLRRPYWIEQGNALVFPFRRRITVENQLDSLRLFVERYPYPTSRTDSLGRIVLDRSTVEAFADTLRGAPPPLSVQPDTVDLRSPSSEFEE